MTWHGVPAGPGVEAAHLGLVVEAGGGHGAQLLEAGLARVQAGGVGGGVAVGGRAPGGVASVA